MEPRVTRRDWTNTVIVVGLLVATVLRLPGLFQDFWLDEIWSWFLVWNPDGTSRISGFWGVFTEIHQDNNNFLQTAWLWLSGPWNSLVWYRLPVLLAGVIAVGVAGQLAARWYPEHPLAARVWGMFLMATSQVYVAYASEGRGYSFALCAAVACHWCLGHIMQRRTLGPATGYAVCASLGFLGHLSFLPVFAAQGAWGLTAWMRGLRKHARAKDDAAHEPRRSLAPPLCVAFGLPALVVAALWWVDLRQSRVGSGPQMNPWSVAQDAWAMPVGSSLPAGWTPLAAVLFLVLVANGLWHLRRLPRMEIVSLAGVIGLAFAILFGLAPAGLVYPRHFLVAWTLLLPAAGCGLAGLWQSARGPWLAILLVMGWLWGNGAELVRFYQCGRGGYQQAIQDLVQADLAAVITVGSDHDFRNGLLLQFYQARSRHSAPAAPGTDLSRLRYVPQQAWGRVTPAWLILHALNRDAGFPPDVTIGPDRFVRFRTYPFAGPVGWHWGLYRREPNENAFRLF